MTERACSGCGPHTEDGCEEDVTVLPDGTVVLRNVVTVLEGQAVRLELEGEQMRMLHSQVTRWWEGAPAE